MKLPEYIIKAFKLKEVKAHGTNITYEETEAIPIKWIEEYIKSIDDDYISLKGAFYILINDWRKENEID